MANTDQRDPRVGRTCNTPPSTRTRQDVIRNEVYSALRQSKPPRERNLTREEQEALRELKSNENIVVVRADKGNCTVVMNKRDYSTQV